MDKRRYGTSPFECVIDLYPDKADLIRRLLMANADFRQLCEDYRLVIETIADIDAMLTKASREAYSEYIALRRELAADIERALVRLAAQ